MKGAARKTRSAVSESYTRDAGAEVDAFIDRYTGPIAQTIRACRARMYALIPRGFELVFDNYNALVFGFAASEKTSDAIVSLAAYPKWVTLFFLRGSDLHDPARLLEGSGKQVRSIRLRDAADLDRPEVQALIVQALAPEAKRFAAAPPVRTIVKSIVAKQRPRRPRGE